MDWDGRGLGIEEEIDRRGWAVRLDDVAAWIGLGGMGWGVYPGMAWHGI